MSTQMQAVEDAIALPGRPLTDKLDLLCRLEAEKEEVDCLAAELEKARELLRQHIIECMEDERLQSFKDPLGRSVRLLEPAVHASIPAESKEEILALIKGEWNAGYAVQETIHPQTLGRLVKERLTEGKSVGPVAYYIRKRLALSRKEKGD